MDENPIKTGLTLEQKLGFAFLFIFAVLFLIISFFQIRANLYRPYALTNAVPDILIKEKFSDPTEALHFRDTDKDGINDFDEIYIYGTSAYLEDTDSDGISDKDEIAQGKNPLCAEGGSCEKQQEEIISWKGLENLIQENVLENTLFDPQTYLKDPKELKKLLISSGVDQKLLDGITDEELVLVGQEIFGSEEFMSALNIQINDTQTTTQKTLSKEELFSNPALLRQALLDTGYVNKEALDKLTDEEVKKAAEQMLDFTP
ncbi:MAG TPA: hypothetical protein PKH95_00510 [Candidatus Magasanikbacteria bacterium]|nr:hypothetical protein [Candidatus Magasanikbacteria bacterium]